MIAYRPDVDGLRAVAILTVVGCHIGLPGWGGGYVGVDVFFVISGYLITSILVTEAIQFHRIDVWGFYARRVRRLLPAFVTVVLATLVLGFLFLVSLDGEQQGLAKSAIAALLLNSNHYFWLSTGSYFDRPSDLHPLLHLWSLSVEEQFYLFWPVGLVALLGAVKHTEYLGRVRIALLIVAIASFAMSAASILHTQSAAFYLMPTRAWELATGALIAVAPLPKANARSLLGATIAAAGLMAIAIAVTTFDRATPFPGPAALLPTLGSAAVIVGNGLAPHAWPSRVLSSRPMVGIGLVSYSWYLWHWPLLAVSRSVRLGEHDLVIDGLLAGVLGLALAVLTYRLIERPIRWSPRIRGLGARATIGVGLLATIISLGAAAGLGAWGKFGPRSERELALAAAQRDVPPMRAQCNNTLRDEPGVPSAAHCVTRNPGRRIDAVLWGDSFADHWTPALAALAAPVDLSVYQLTRDSCPPLLGFGIEHGDPTQTELCKRFNRIALDEMRRLRSEGALRGAILSANWAQHAGRDIEPALRESLDRLDELSIRVLIVRSSPRLRYRAPECLLRRDAIRCALPRVDLENERRAADEAIASVAKGRRNVRVVDPARFMCNGDVCPPIRDGIVLYTDGGHMTATASRGFGQYLEDDIAWLMGGPIQ